jgi:GDPmannose 4,6-dehydratase
MLLERGYEVTGVTRRGGSESLGSAEHLRGRVRVLPGDLLVPETLTEAVETVRPHEIYHLGAPTFVPDSWHQPTRTVTEIIGSTAALLEAVCERSTSTRLFVAGSSAMFGDTIESPQREETPCGPLSPYATAKLAAYQLVSQLRGRSNIFACTGILYNHESERRPEMFVTRKITRGAAAIKLGLARELALGDVAAVRDWSFAGDVMRGAWLMLQHEVARDYVLASGVGHTVDDVVKTAFAAVGLDPKDHVRTDQSLVRTADRTVPVGDPSRARKELGWVPTLTFEQLIARMVDADLRDLAQAPGP